MKNPDESSVPVVDDWRWAVAVGLVVAVMQGALVVAIGTDLPWWDQWGVEGRALYPRLVDGSFAWSQIWETHNEHRIVWTHLLNMGLWGLNGQWDASGQQLVGVLLRSFLAGWLTWRLGRGRRWFGVLVVGAFSPVAAWHNAIWGFQSQVYFTLVWGGLAISCAARAEGRIWLVAGLLSAAAAVAMGPGMLVPLAGAGMLLWATVVDGKWRERAGPLVGIILFAGLILSGRGEEAEGTDLRSGSLAQIWDTWWLGMAWPHAGTVMAGLVVEAPLIVFVGLGFTRFRSGFTARDRELVGLGLWVILIVGGMAVARGGGEEMQAGVPSRYVDFLVVGLVVNGAALVRLRSWGTGRWPRVVAVIWGGFLLVGWAGVNAENWRGVVGPRMVDREAPIEMMRAFQVTGDESIFEGAPKLYRPYPDLGVVREVLADERMQGRLPPSLQVGETMGVVSRIGDWIRTNAWPLGGILLGGAIALLIWDDRLRRAVQSRVRN